MRRAFPVPIEGVAVGSTSLATIFLVAGADDLRLGGRGRRGFLAMALVELGGAGRVSRVAFNCGVYVIAGIAAGRRRSNDSRRNAFRSRRRHDAAAVAFYLVDITLLAAVVSRSRQLRFLSSLRNYVHLTLMPFAIMASLTVVLVVLWDRSPYVAVVLAGPLLATAIYQRWIHGALERLREFDRLKDEFIAIVSHELRTPLTSVYGAAVTLRNRELDDTRRNLLLDIVSTESARLGRLLDDVLWVSRLDSGRSRAVHHSCGAARARDGTSSMRPELTYRPGFRSISALTPPPFGRRRSRPAAPSPREPDRERGQVLDGRDGSRFALRVAARRRLASASATKGRGIPSDEAERIFEKFYRLDPNMTQGVGGTGLGLYICRELIDGMQGQIWVDSELGKGSTFTFELPRTAR